MISSRLAFVLLSALQAAQTAHLSANLYLKSPGDTVDSIFDPSESADLDNLE